MKSIQTPLGVYTDDEVGIEMIESYVNQRLVEELEKIKNGNLYSAELEFYLIDRIQQLKHD